MNYLSWLKKYLQQSWESLTEDWQVFREAPIPASELNQTFLQASLPALNFYLLLALAAAIATFGLLTNSAATIIGAMIIAPLMNPIITLAYALVTLRLRLFERGIFTVVTGIVLVIAIAYLTTEILGLRVVGTEILARTKPNSLDLGVAIAAGTAAGFANTRRSIASTLAGVAISVALVPPLSVVGIGLCLGNLGTFVATTRGVETSIPIGSFLLFTTNLLGIIFSGSLVFLWQGYGNLKKSLLGIVITFLSLLILLEPLRFSLKTLYIESLTNETMFELRQNQPDLFTNQALFRSVNTQYGKDNLVHINVSIELPEEEMATIQQRIDLAAIEIDKAVKQSLDANIDVELVVDIIPFQRIKGATLAP